MRVTIGEREAVLGNLTLSADKQHVIVQARPEQRDGVEALVRDMQGNEPAERFLARLPLELRNGYLWAVMGGMDWTDYLNWVADHYPIEPAA